MPSTPDHTCRITNFFYKNMVAIGVLFWFQIYSFWSSA
jgi:phospholipid-translocating ATPase